MYRLNERQSLVILKRTEAAVAVGEEWDHQCVEPSSEGNDAQGA
jgi:hypothetical protein